jgi:transposase InsO family protein
MGKRNKVVKLTKKKIDYIIRAKTRNDSNKNISVDMKISKSTVKRVWTHWLKYKAPIPIKKFGRKKQVIDEKSVELIIKVQKEQKLGARRLERIIDFKHKQHIPHNRIHDVLLENGLAKRNKNKSRRRKAWIRYERKHSLSAVHLDWHTGKVIKKEVCVVEDDSSRFILAGGEFDAATADFSINLVQEVLDNYGWFGKIKQAITDRGTQFYANKKDKNEESQSRFEAFLLEKEIQHIKARVKHPQTNGKVEKWFDLYEKYRLEFETFADFVKWYNTTRYHESLDQKHFLQTPENAFWARLPEGSKLNIFLKRMEVELNVYGRIYKQNEHI